MTDQALGNFLFSYAVVADTHLNQNDLECNSPFEVNRLANARLRWVIADLNTRDISHVIHLGDIVHPVPSMGDLYVDSAARFSEQTATLKHPLYVIPGNHDVGDKPIEWGPAGTIRQSFLDAWSDNFGDHYFAHQHHGIWFIGLNIQLLGSGLPLEQEQNLWLESTLHQHQGERIMLFTHYPPFLFSEDEGEHYDNLSIDSRNWLLSLIDQFQIEALFAGHVHHFWYNRYHQCDCYLLPSTCFTRQDYSEMFRIGPAEELGRNDADKLGYLLVHVYENRQLIEMVRSYGSATDPKASVSILERVAPVNAQTNDYPVMGFDLRQDWCEQVQIPPSGGLDEFDRKWVRNDYGLLALWEMGVRYLRIPVADIVDPTRRQRLIDLHHLGFCFTAYSFGCPGVEVINIVKQHPGLVQQWEIGFRERIGNPDEVNNLSLLKEMGIRIFATPVLDKASVLASGKKYYHVINHGFNLATFDAAKASDAEMISAAIVDVFDGIVVRCSFDDSIEKTFELINWAKKHYDMESILHLRLTADNPADYQNDNQLISKRIAETMALAWFNPQTRVFCDTLSDNDRGYFPRSGVLDRRFNPKSGFHVVKCMHGLISKLGNPQDLKIQSNDSVLEKLQIETSNGEFNLLLNQSEPASWSDTVSWLHWRNAAMEHSPPNQNSDFPLAWVAKN